MMEAARTSETSVDIKLRTRQYIPEDSELHMYLLLLLGWIRFIFGPSQNSFICGHVMKNRFEEFHLRSHDEKQV
jgi:hypothetical protein